jgi:hypothetical protein
MPADFGKKTLEVVVVVPAVFRSKSLSESYGTQPFDRGIIMLGGNEIRKKRELELFIDPMLR